MVLRVNFPQFLATGQLMTVNDTETCHDVEPATVNRGGRTRAGCIPAARFFAIVELPYIKKMSNLWYYAKVNKTNETTPTDVIKKRI